MAVSRKRQRGFVIVIVVAIAAVITAIVASQLTSSQKLAVASLRMEEEVQARAIAQACLEMVTAQIDNYMFDCGGAPPLPACATRPPDFDGLLLGVDGNPNTSDDFLPGIGDPVQIPRSSSDRLHQWALFDLDGGACAMRIEDNSDDARPVMPGMNAATETANGEGTGVDVPVRDRDLAVYVHVIGMFPRLTTVDADVYHKAHARSTLKRLIQKQNMASPSGPALWAGAEVDIDDDNNICELGGVMAPRVDMESSTCACGPINCTTCLGTPAAGSTCAACTTGCTPSSDAGVETGPPPVNVHWADVASGTGFLKNESIGPPLRADVTANPGIGQGALGPVPTTNYELSNSQVCAFYGESNGGTSNRALFVWDRLDPDAAATLDNWTDGVWNVGATTHHPQLIGLTGGTPVNCTTHTGDVPPPCVWTAGATAATPSTIASCPTAKSACWKLVAWLDRAENYAVGLGGAAPQLGWTDNSSDTGFHPKRSVPIPNTARIGPTAIASTFGNAILNQQLLCGDTNPARNCSACSVNPLDTLDTNAVAVLETHSDHWHFEGGANNSTSPSPSIWFLENTGEASKDTHIKDVGNLATGPFRASFIVDGTVEVETNAAICCATCDCTPMVAALAMGTCALNGTFGDSVTGVANGRVGALIAANPALRTDTDNPPADNRNLIPPLTASYKGGYAIKSSKRINVNNDALIIGDIRGAPVDFNNDPCIVGSVVGYGGSCAPCNSTPASVCFNNDTAITGDVHSMTGIFLNNSPRIWGNVLAKTNVCFNNDARVEGLVQAGSTMRLNNDSMIVNNVSSTAGPATTALNQALTTFMEGAW